MAIGAKLRALADDSHAGRATIKVERRRTLSFSPNLAIRQMAFTGILLTEQIGV